MPSIMLFAPPLEQPTRSATTDGAKATRMPSPRCRPQKSDFINTRIASFNCTHATDNATPVGSICPHHESMLRGESGGCSPMRLLLVGLGLVHSGTVCNEPGFENYRRGGDCVRPPLPVCTDPQAANYLPPGPGMPRRDTTRYTRAHPGAIALTCTYERFSQVGTLRSLSNYRRAAGTTCMHAMMTMPTTLCGHGS